MLHHTEVSTYLIICCDLQYQILFADIDSLLFQLEGQMKENLAVIKNNCDSLDSRIKVVQK